MSESGPMPPRRGSASARRVAPERHSATGRADTCSAGEQDLGPRVSNYLRLDKRRLATALGEIDADMVAMILEVMQEARAVNHSQWFVVREFAGAGAEATR